MLEHHNLKLVGAEGKLLEFKPLDWALMWFIVDVSRSEDVKTPGQDQ